MHIQIVGLHAPNAPRLRSLLGPEYEVEALQAFPETGLVRSDVVISNSISADEAARLRCRLLHVPEGAVLDLHTSNGSVTRKGGQGKARIRTSNGSIVVTGATGALELKTSNGPVRVEADRAVVKVETSNGEVRFQGTLADGEHTFATSNGRVPTSSPAAFLSAAFSRFGMKLISQSEKRSM